MQRLPELVQEKFRELFGREPILIRSPGRVNLIGEHTDYNEGFVLPAAINHAIYFAVALQSDSRCQFYAYDVQESFVCDTRSFRKNEPSWANYLMGVLDEYRKLGYEIPGVQCVFGGDIPIAAGLSSSAALEAGFAFALNHLMGWELEPLELVKLAQRAENEFVGVQCGIMDQFANIFGREKKVIRLDCRTLEHEYYPFDREDVRIVLCDSGVSRELHASEYNLRRQQCEQAVAVLHRSNPQVRSLRDVTLEMLIEHRKEMPPVVFRRAKYVLEENERVLQACRRLQENNFEAFGDLMYASHAGLRDDYQVSCDELDLLVNATFEMEGVLGARLMGAGFGGCTINLVWQDYLKEFLREMERVYHEQLMREPKIYVTGIVAGTSVMNG